MYLTYQNTRTTCKSRDTCTSRTETRELPVNHVIPAPHVLEHEKLSSVPLCLQFVNWQWEDHQTRICIASEQGCVQRLRRTEPNGQGLTPLPPPVNTLKIKWGFTSPRYAWHFFKWLYNIGVCSINMSLHVITREVSVTHALKLMVQFVGKTSRVTTRDIHAHHVHFT